MYKYIDNYVNTKYLHSLISTEVNLSEQTIIIAQLTTII